MSHMIDTSAWGEFLLEDLFESIERGKCGNVSALAEGGTPYVGASLTNNGVARKVDSGDGVLLGGGNAIVLICTGQGGIGRNTYQAEPFIAHANVAVARHHMLNNLVGLFLVACLDKSVEVYGYEYSTGRDLTRESVHLPITPTGDPDWQYMESTMRGIMAERERALDALAPLLLSAADAH